MCRKDVGRRKPNASGLIKEGLVLIGGWLWPSVVLRTRFHTAFMRALCHRKLKAESDRNGKRDTWEERKQSTEKESKRGEYKSSLQK